MHKIYGNAVVKGLMIYIRLSEKFENIILKDEFNLRFLYKIFYPKSFTYYHFLLLFVLYKGLRGKMVYLLGNERLRAYVS